MSLIDSSTAPLLQHCDMGCGAVKPLLRRASRPIAPLRHCFLLFQKNKINKVGNMYVGMDRKIDGAVAQFAKSRVVIGSQVLQVRWSSSYCAMEQCVKGDIYELCGHY
jgi:hypothetical protein